MLSKQLLTSSCFFVICAIIKANDDAFCIDEPPVENFKAEKYSGVFYTYALQDEKQSNWACIRQFVYAPEDDGTLPLVYLWKNENDNSTHMLLKNAKMNKTGQGETTDGDKLTVIGADYHDYLVLFGCDVEANKRFVWVLTSEPNPGLTDLSSIHDIFDKYNMSLNDLSIVDQSSCPDDWSTAQIHAVDFQYDGVKDDLQELNITKAH